MRQSRTSGSVGAPGGRLPGATRPAPSEDRNPAPGGEFSLDCVARLETPRQP